MGKKLYDLSVKTGEFSKDGETKNRYQSIGSMMENDEGKPFLLLYRWFNLAACVVREGSDAVLVSCFEPREPGSKDKPAPRARRNEDSGDAPF